MRWNWLTPCCYDNAIRSCFLVFFWVLFIRSFKILIISGACCLLCDPCRDCYRETWRGDCSFIIVGSIPATCDEFPVAGPSWLCSVKLGILSGTVPYSPLQSYSAFYLIGNSKWLERKFERAAKLLMPKTHR